MTEQLFLTDTDSAPEGALFVSTDTLVERHKTPLAGTRYMVNWKMIGAYVKTTMRPVRQVQLSSGVMAYTNVVTQAK